MVDLEDREVIDLRLRKQLVSRSARSEASRRKTMRTERIGKPKEIWISLSLSSKCRALLYLEVSLASLLTNQMQIGAFIVVVGRISLNIKSLNLAKDLR